MRTWRDTDVDGAPKKNEQDCLLGAQQKSFPVDTQVCDLVLMRGKQSGTKQRKRAIQSDAAQWEPYSSGFNKKEVIMLTKVSKQAKCGARRREVKIMPNLFKVCIPGWNRQNGWGFAIFLDSVVL